MKILFISPEITPFAKTGGLADTIRNGANGFTFFDFKPSFFFDSVKRAVDTYRDQPEMWKQMMITAMDQDYSWEKSAEKYLTVYNKVLGKTG